MPSLVHWTFQTFSRSCTEATLSLFSTSASWSSNWPAENPDAVGWWTLVSKHWLFTRSVEIEHIVLHAFRGTADWFGVSKDGDATQKWQRKSLRHCSLRYGKLKPQVIREMELPSQDNISLTSTETPPPLYVPSSQHGIPKVCQYIYSTGLLQCLNKVSSVVLFYSKLYCFTAWIYLVYYFFPELYIPWMCKKQRHL